MNNYESEINIYKNNIRKQEEDIILSFDFIKKFITEIIDNIHKKIDLIKIESLDIDILSSDILKSLPLKIMLNDFYNYLSNYIILKSSEHWYYDVMAKYILVQKIYNITPGNIMSLCYLLKNYTYNDKKHCLMSQRYIDFVENNHIILQKEINMDRDYLFDFFGIKTLEKIYLIKDLSSPFKIIERPQFMFIRVAIEIHDDIDLVLETYHMISQKYFIHATPTLFNSGMKINQLSSCFLHSIDDNIESIFDAIKDFALISKHAGGIGISLSAIRSTNSIIRGTNGFSKGIIPLCILLDKESKYINQGGKRNGSFAVYLEPWHYEIFDFCDLRKNIGNEDNRTRDLNIGLWIPSLFIERVKKDEIWSLMCPNECPNLNLTHSEEFNELYLKYEKEKKYRKQIKARDLWLHIITSIIETGFPYILFKDSANKKSNQKNLGTIRNSNLCSEIIQYSSSSETSVCLDKNTEVITRDGIKKIRNCKYDDYLVYYDNKFNKIETYEHGTKIYKGYKKVYMIKAQGMPSLKATCNHKILIKKGNKPVWTTLKKIKIGDYLYTPVLKFCNNINKIFNFKWLFNGWIFLNNKINFKKDLKKIKEKYHNKYKKIFYKVSTIKKKIYYLNKQSIYFRTFLSQKIKTLNKRELIGFLSGIFSYIGKVNKSSIYIMFNYSKITYDIQYLLTTLGIRSKVTSNIRCHKLYINEYKHIINFIKIIGFELINDQKKIEKIKKINNTTNNIEKENLSKIKKIKYIGIRKVYDIVLKKHHNFIANGIVVHNCNLASICLPRFILPEKKYDFKTLIKVCRIIVRNLNNIIDNNFYPTIKSKISNLNHRPIGIGVQGLADTYNIMEYSFDSTEAEDLNKKIFESIYYACLDESKNLAKKHGHYKSFPNSPFSQGKLQFHLWNVHENDLCMNYDWKKLINEIIKYGTRNSLLTTVMPTASTSQIMGNNECIEPYLSNIYKKTTLAGEFIIINKNLMKKLIDLNLWNDDLKKKIIINNGSIQNIKEIPENIKNIYKTAFEIKQRKLLKQNVDRGIFIDQSQSFNIFMKKPDFNIINSILIKSHDFGCKTGMYYCRSLPAVNAINFGIDIEEIKKLSNVKKYSDHIINSYKINFDNDCLECSS